MNNAELTLYYDGACGLCRAEMTRLRRWDRAGRLCLIDIAVPGFTALPGDASLPALNTEMHVLTADGRLLVGIDAILAAYTAVGRGWMVAPLRLRWLRPMLRAMYRALARHRYRLSALLGRPACDDGVCVNKHPLG